MPVVLAPPLLGEGRRLVRQRPAQMRKVQGGAQEISKKIGGAAVAFDRNRGVAGQSDRNRGVDGQSGESRCAGDGCHHQAARRGGALAFTDELGDRRPTGAAPRAGPRALHHLRNGAGALAHRFTNLSITDAHAEADVHADPQLRERVGLILNIAFNIGASRGMSPGRIRALARGPRSPRITVGHRRIAPAARGRPRQRRWVDASSAGPSAPAALGWGKRIVQGCGRSDRRRTPPRERGREAGRERPPAAERSAVRRHIVRPPSTSMQRPLKYSHSITKRTACQMSSGTPMRPTGIMATKASRAF